jgi:hypothetical protein
VVYFSDCIFDIETRKCGHRRIGCDVKICNIEKLSMYIKRKYILALIFVVFAAIAFLCLHPPGRYSLSNKSAYSINNDGQITNIHLEKKSKEDFVLIADVLKKNKLVLTNSWHFNYEVFRIDTGDVNNDNSTDILVGVIKSTRFDPVSRKRLFIFKLFEGYIRPLWLGSRVSQPLIDFKFVKCKSEGVVRTIESEKDQSYLVAEYHWIGFGLRFMHYLGREKTIHQAYKILNTNVYEPKRQGFIHGTSMHQSLGLPAAAQ